MEETERCTRRGGSGLVMVADGREEESVLVPAETG
jgi:hypothetical protein